MKVKKQKSLELAVHFLAMRKIEENVNVVKTPLARKKLTLTSTTLFPCFPF
jgi:hypothetical protein